MTDHANHYTELELTFPSHEIHLDVSVSAKDPWAALVFCAQAFQKFSLTPKRINLTHGTALRFRVRCPNHNVINQLQACFADQSSPTVLEWVVEIGRPNAPSRNGSAAPLSLA